MDPALDEAADAVGLSPFHFQRLFTRWAGVSPRAFVASIAHAEARTLLEDGASVFDAALDTGLSGPSRLHDLFIAQESVTPGEARRRGEGLTLRWGLFFLFLAVLNEIVWRTQTTDFWVSFKAFGIMPLTIAFALAQVPLIMKYELKDETKQPEAL